MISGILLLNKPLHITSNRALQQVKRLFGAEKAGHTGSLDPLATGLLPICFGEATKFSQYLLDSDKTYRVTGMLGSTTTTGDLAGEILSTVDYRHIPRELLLQAIEKFQGKISQIPPMYSAIKQQGQPLYQLAREGRVVERVPRNITIYKIELLRFEEGQFDLLVKCSKGTYIRTLVEDIGAQCGVGAHVIALHRVGVSSFEEYSMIDWPTLESHANDPVWLNKQLLPIDAGIQHYPVVALNATEVEKLYWGQTVWRSLPAGLYRLVDEAQQFIGMGMISEGVLSVSRLLKSLPPELVIQRNAVT